MYVERYLFSIFVVVKVPKLPINEYKIINQYRLTYALCGGFESRKLFEYYKKRSCVGNRTDTSALSEWMVVRPFRSLVQLRGSPNASGLQTHDLFL